MSCAAAIAIAIQVNADLTLTFTPISKTGMVSVSDDGDLHFRKAKKTCVDVTMAMTGGTFASNPLYYADDPDQQTYDQVQFGSTTGQIRNLKSHTDGSISFTYYNYDTVGCILYKYRYSGYHIDYLVSNNLQEWDPVVTNGGNGQSQQCGPKATRHRRARHRS